MNWSPLIVWIDPRWSWSPYITVMSVNCQVQSPVWSTHSMFFYTSTLLGHMHELTRQVLLLEGPLSPNKEWIQSNSQNILHLGMCMKGNWWKKTKRRSPLQGLQMQNMQPPAHACCCLVYAWADLSALCRIGPVHLWSVLSPLEKQQTPCH